MFLFILSDKPFNRVLMNMNIRNKITNFRLLKYFTRCSSTSTIFNLSSGYGKCGVSVVRVSGPQTRQALQSIVSKGFNPKERYAYLRSLYHPISGEMIDKGLVLWFAGPKSFTGEDSCEFQVHGGIAVVEAMLDALSNVPGLRVSQPGEFTKRAFFSGKLDLTEVDGLADLIHAETEAQRKQALLQSTGSLSRLYQSWRKGLIKCVAHMEAYIDFAEDENIEDDLIENLKNKLSDIASDIQNHLSDQRQGEILREGVRTVIVGPPNVGKSSFLNLMCQRQVSIVTAIPGTTRDVIQTSYNICGYPVLFADTAGLRQDTEDVVEKEGISRAKDCIQDSDLILLLVDANDIIKNSIATEESFHKFQKSYLQDLGIDPKLLEQKKFVTIFNKIDLLSMEDAEKLSNLDIASISCTQNNLGNLLHKLENELKLICDQPSAENPRLTHFRYRQELVRCLEHINVFLKDISQGETTDLAIVAQKLRRAVKCIEVITGDVSTDDILDVVFKDFCIGK